MDIDYLIRMADDIGAFFASEADQSVAAANILAHIKRYWDPRMRAKIVAHYRETKGIGLEGAVLEAVQRLAQEASAKS
jgi:formate dehydrogenase subunit delta